LEVYGDNTYRYDEDGYLTEKTTPDGKSTYTYNTLGSLTKVVLPDNTTINYYQNVLNQRVAKEVNGTIVQKYLWRDLATLLAVYDKDDNLVQRFEYADQRMPVAMTQNGQRYYLHYDQVGSLRAVSDTNGNVVKEIVYDTYGNIISDSNPSFRVPFGFAGGLYDPDTKLTHFGYREYDAYTGKWTAKDPIGFAGGDSNLYGYVLGDPVNLVDPEGLFAPAVYYAFYYAAMFASGYWAIHESIPHARNLANFASPSISLPWNGEPNSTGRCKRDDGTPKQKRRYGPDGTPLQDIDYDHDHGHGSPHVHDWDGKKREPGRKPIDTDGDLDFDAD